MSKFRSWWGCCAAAVLAVGFGCLQAAGGTRGLRPVRAVGHAAPAVQDGRFDPPAELPFREKAALVGMAGKLEQTKSYKLTIPRPVATNGSYL